MTPAGVLTGGLVMAAAIALVLGARALLLRVVRHDGRASVVDTVMEPLAGVYGLLLAFLVSGVADRAALLRAAAQEEAAAYDRLEQVAQHLPQAVGVRLQRALQRYARSELAARAGHPTADRGVTALHEVWVTIATFEANKAIESILQAQALDDVRVLREQRAIAERASHPAHSGAIWLILIVGTCSVVGVCALASLGDPRGPIYLTALTAVIAVTLYVLYVLSQPIGVAPFKTLAGLLAS
ncbi:MAG TPA: hypothetical protein VGC44_02490 [Longimicrobiales bacterium]